MDKKLLLNDSLHFLGLSPGFTESELKESYHKLAKKYHPDSGEFTSDVMFLELNKHYESLKDFLLIHPEEESFPSGNQENNDPNEKGNPLKPSKDPVFHEYKQAKEKETEAILRYYEKRNLHPIELSENANKELVQLRKDLEPVLSVYTEILKKHPTSLWAKDAKDSLERLRVWWA
ncbi:DnaJ domain-containing protein [Leptospira sp. 2 VSF19]|uniref:DnaJ domain-containing protein n=1 Tax=Leptospira soteropolitanensis TaxID=2950025 RepID=A0AAW5VIA8_9LEPT|nr:DnaJ domain-containing protein [Leptospira soteropolitanensis]MCW7492784.1 DnaJ domain-containing protein [Leptospira soteropolitanensis]MCW7500019.1 DnaJ domain-containing protein [Leptospira soteropolitanensis]MCW7522270.1 DnaJ domain-containing protein [Leptospira soteropolitanensis]MCW7526126.1 DnaJ domain-containing protein [Leptospira soteropolitanensis]MCW7529762.1 DnaJ domain-containing protein [Leptospira soteropolitanensis]